MCLVRSLGAAAPFSKKQGLLLKEAIRTLRRLLLFSGLTLFAALNLYSAQGLSGVTGLQVYAGITVTGTVGYVYAIQTTTDLSNPDSWVNLVITNLPSNPFLYIDTQNPASGNRFYRIKATR